MALDLEDARKFLRSEFNFDVADDDPILMSYMLGQLSLDHMEPQLREVASKVATDVVLNSHDVLEKAHGSIVKVADHVAGMQEAMKVTIHAAEKAQRLHDMLDEKLAALDEKIAAFDARIVQTDALAQKMTKSASGTTQAVVALTSGLLKIQPRSIWKRDRPS